MELVVFLARVVGFAAAAVVLVRALVVLNELNWRTRNRSALGWSAFGWSYLGLGAAAAGSLLVLLTRAPAGSSDYLWIGMLVWLATSAGMILSDRRIHWRGRRSSAANDGQHVVQFETFWPLCRHVDASPAPGPVCTNPYHAGKTRPTLPCAEACCPLLVEQDGGRVVVFVRRHKSAAVGR